MKSNAIFGYPFLIIVIIIRIIIIIVITLLHSDNNTNITCFDSFGTK